MQGVRIVRGRVEWSITAILLSRDQSGSSLCLTENLAGAGKLFSDAPRAEPPPRCASV